MRPYLSWIEGLTTNQYVGGSNPSGRTTFELVKTLLVRGFSFFFKYQLVLGANGDESIEEGYQSQLRAKNNTTENNNRA